MLAVHDITIRVADQAPSVGSQATKQYRKVMLRVPFTSANGCAHGASSRNATTQEQ